MIFFLSVFSLAAYAQFSIPDEIKIAEKKEIESNGIFTFRLEKGTKTASTDTAEKSEDEYELNVSLFNVIPLRKSKVTMNRRRYVTISGEVFGIRLYADGVVIVSLQDVLTDSGIVNPGKNAGLRSGDIIRKIDGRSVISNNEVSEICKNSNGKELKISYERNGEKLTTKLKTVKEKKSGAFKAGLWVRDSTAGIGTMTFYDRETGIFAGLGHAVCDVDTGIELPLSGGDAVSAKILGCYKSTDGKAGELCGVFANEDIGRLYINGNTGLFGVLSRFDSNAEIIPVAISQEVKLGKVQLLSSADGGKPKLYDAEITKINSNEGSQKNMTVKVTDKRLLQITGGIVQGMSGTPLIQNGMFVGAVTHVFVNSPREGYAIFAENMIVTADELEEMLTLKNAS